MADDKPPEYFTQGAGYGKLNQWLAFILDHLFIPGDDSITAIPGNGTGPGRIFANGGSGGAVSPAPFDITLSTSGSTTTATFRPGTVNQLLPGNIFTPQTVTTTGTVYCTLDASTDGKTVTAATINVGGGAPAAAVATMGAAPGSFRVLLYVLVAGTPFRVWDRFNIAATVDEIIRTPKAAPTPGQPAYDLWYAWDVRATASNL